MGGLVDREGLRGLPAGSEVIRACATLGVNEQVPKPTKVTVSPFVPTLQTPGVLEVTDFVPSPFVPTIAVKPKNSLAGEGMLVMVGVEGTARPTVTFWARPSWTGSRWLLPPGRSGSRCRRRRS